MHFCTDFGKLAGGTAQLSEQARGGPPFAMRHLKRPWGRRGYYDQPEIALPTCSSGP